MQLVFEVCTVDSASAEPSARKVFDAVGGVIGRGPGCDWVIPDPSRVLSSHHGLVGYREGRYFLTDISRNGIGVAGSVERLRKGQARLINDGDVFELGALALRARLLQPARPCGELRATASAAVPIPDDAFLSLDPLHVLDLDHRQHSSSDDLEALSEAVDEQGVWAERHGTDREHVTFPRRAEPGLEVAAVHVSAMAPSADEVFWSQFAAALGVGLDARDPAAREVLAIKVAGLFRLTIQGLQQALRTREELHHEWGRSSFDSPGAARNPLKMFSDTNAALSALLDTGDLGQMPASRAIGQAHRELQVHQVALQVACRSTVNKVYTAFEPNHLAWCFESQGKPPRFFTDGARWRAYQRHYQRLMAQGPLSDRPLSGDFATAYEEQVRLISSLHIDFSG